MHIFKRGFAGFDMSHDEFFIVRGESCKKVNFVSTLIDIKTKTYKEIVRVTKVSQKSIKKCTRRKLFTNCVRLQRHSSILQI